MRRPKNLFILTLVAALAAAGLSVGAPSAQPASPLAAYPGFGHDLVADEARFTLEEQEREELVAGCMASKGFQYLPTPSIVITGDEAEPPDLTDPNDAYVGSLTPAERSAYHLALAGVENPNAEEADALTSAGGCVADAHRVVPGVYGARTLLAAELDAMEEAIAQDPRLLRAMRGWSGCMRSRGFAFTSPAQTYALLDERVGTLSDSTVPVDIEALIQTHQRALEASDECSDDLRATSARVRSEAEERFVHEHRDTLEGYS